jgi:perosamine synthetase
MAISRGSIRHTLGEDFTNTIRSLTQKSALAARASASERQELCAKISRQFGFDEVVLFPYARSAFYAILKSLDLPPKSEILLTPITIGPMLEVILALGHRPVFVDIELETFCVDIDDLRAKLGRRPTCFLLTYLFGYVPNIEAVADLCRAAGTALLEDISHNIGATYKGRSLGSFGTAAIYSASLLKYVDAYNGAFAVTRDPALAARLRDVVSTFTDPDPARISGIIRTTFVWNFCLRRIPFTMVVYPLLSLIKALDKEAFEKLLGARIDFKPLDTLPGYYFENIAKIQCETMSKQLDKLEKLLEERLRDVALADDVGSKVLGRPVAPATRPGEARHTYWQFITPVSDLAQTRDALFRAGVETGATNLMNLADVYGVEAPNAQRLKGYHIFIPIHRGLKRSHYMKMFSTLKRCTRQSASGISISGQHFEIDSRRPTP